MADPKFNPDKIKERRERAGLTQSDLAHAVSVSASTIHRIECGYQVPRRKTILAIEQALKLAERRLGDIMGLEWQAEQNVIRRAGRVRGDPQNRIPLINRVPAGEPCDFTNLDYPAGVADNWIDRGDISDDLAFAFYVFGDSMLPEYRYGDIAVAGGSVLAQPGDDCFVRFSMESGVHPGECSFKRIDFTDGNVILRALNPAYPVQVVPREWIEQCYPVIEVRRRVLKR